MSKSEMRERKRFTGSTFVKIVVYFLLAISIFIGGVSAGGTLYLASNEVYNYGDSTLGLESMAKEMMSYDARMDAREYYNLRWPEDEKEALEQLENFCKNKNIRIEVWQEYDSNDVENYAGPECVLKNYGGFDTPYVYSSTFQELTQVPVVEEEKEEYVTPKDSNDDITEEIPESGVIQLEEGNQNKANTNSKNTNSSTTNIGVDKNETTTLLEETEIEETKYKDLWVWYEITVYVDPALAAYDNYKVAYDHAVAIWELRNMFPVIGIISIFVAAICFIFLMCGAGHKNGKSGITPGVLTPIHLDILTVVFGFVAALGLILGVEGGRGFDDETAIVFFMLAATIVGVWCTIYCAELALRFKLGQWWKHTIIYSVLRILGKIVRFFWNTLATLLKGLPLIFTTVMICAGVVIVEVILFALWGIDDAPFIWLLEKIILIPTIFYIALVCKKLQEGSAALAEGNLNYKVDTSKMALDFKIHGENLNRIGEGISKAVNERMKSEHLKTELITNVSHDIKTPLTSIINYADLLGNVANEENHLNQEKVAEYSEVLLRQSKRLKKLLEDLVEASKATTGNIEVKMEKCQIGVLLSQAVGEYESRFWEKQLELIVKQPEEPVWIMADGRRLWRVFDNLLNNVCKYAQENTRVYLTVEPKDAQVEIIFRNMSKYALDMTGEELEERFVRGDKSRHMEGNGLGLSIAKSLVELQNGTMEIVTDGDLFKVILKFAMLLN